MTGPMSVDGSSHEPAPCGRSVEEAWEFLRIHPSFVWIPPALRDQGDEPGEVPCVRAIEMNIVVSLVPNGGKSNIRLSTGPLRDGDSGDPLVPTMTYDPRLNVEGSTFESAVIALAERVRALYGE